MDRIEFAQLVLLGIQPSEVARMSLQQIYDVLALHEAHEAMQRGKMPGE